MLNLSHITAREGAGRCAGEIAPRYPGRIRMAPDHRSWSRGREFAAALRSSLRLSARLADDFHLLWTGWPAGGGPPLRLGDLLPDGGRPLRAHVGGAGVRDHVEVVDPDDLWTCHPGCEAPSGALSLSDSMGSAKVPPSGGGFLSRCSPVPDRDLSFNWTETRPYPAVLAMRPPDRKLVRHLQPPSVHEL